MCPKGEFLLVGRFGFLKNSKRLIGSCQAVCRQEVGTTHELRVNIGPTTPSLRLLPQTRGIAGAKHKEPENTCPVVCGQEGGVIHDWGRGTLASFFWTDYSLAEVVASD